MTEPAWITKLFRHVCPNHGKKFTLWGQNWIWCRLCSWKVRR